MKFLKMRGKTSKTRPLTMLVIGFFCCIHTTVYADYFFVIDATDTGYGTLRQAILDANAHAGADEIIFEIGSTGSYQTIWTNSALPTITDPVTINGWSQGGLGYHGPPLVELYGNYAGSGVHGLIITAGNCTIQGLIINRFSESGIVISTNGNNSIGGCYIGTNYLGTSAMGNGVNGIVIEESYNNTIGGWVEDTRNIISGNSGNGVSINGTTTIDANNQIVGNYIGTDVSGTYALGNGLDGIWINGSSSNTVGGTANGAGNVISGNGDDGIQLAGTHCADTQILGNYIGTNATGTAGIGNGWGVYIQGATGTYLGGFSEASRNIISGNTHDGIRMATTYTSGNRVMGNYIGTDVYGTSAIGNYDGIWITASTFGNTIGGTTEEMGNLIAHNTRYGICVESGVSNQFRKNSIFSNGNLGIDLETDGVTMNDAQDPDTGPNNLQNRPILSSAVSSGGSTTIQGSLNSTPDRDFIIDFYSNAVPDATNYGEGEDWIGSTTVHTNAGSGSIPFNVTLPSVTVPGGYYITATATDDVTDDTSEFSQVQYVANTDMNLEVQRIGGNLQLTWSSVSGVSAYWIYGACNNPYFDPGLTSPYYFRITTVGSGTTTWSSMNGVGDIANNWSYLIIAVDGSSLEISRSNRAGEFDFGY